MEYMSPRGFSLKPFLCVYVCLLACVNLGLSLKCNKVECGHGTESVCNKDGSCKCSKPNHFSNRQRAFLFGQDVQYCLRGCYRGNPCPGNYTCTSDEGPSLRCVCAVGYRRSFNGECEGYEAACEGLSCATGQYCSKTKDGAVCDKKSCEMGYQLTATGECIGKCDEKNPCPMNYFCKYREPSSPNWCVCAVGYRRSVNGECVGYEAACAGLSCRTGQFCSKKKDNMAVCRRIDKSCDMGYQHTATGECIDIDECQNKTTCHDKRNTRCVNKPGSFKCKCLQGYTKSDNEHCTDIDDCQNKTTCHDKRNTRCVNKPGSFKCKCLQGYTKSDNEHCTDIDECLLDDGICEDKNNTVCVNTQGSFNCECLPGYSSDNNTSCQDIDECVKEPCGEHSVCKNVPGNYSCRCKEGYTLTIDENSTCVINERAAARVTDGNGGSSVGLYVGVTVGVLVLLGLIVAAIFVRRRRNSKKSPEGGAQFSSGEPERKQNSCNGYDNVSLDNEDVDLSSETRKEKTVSVEYSNSKIPRNNISRNSSSISVEYSNNKILSSTKRNGKRPVSSKPTQHPTVGDDGLEDQGGYGKEGILPHNNHPEMMAKSPNPVITAKLDDSAAYNTLDAFILSAKNKSPTQHQIAGVTSESESQGVYNTLYEEHVLPNNNKENMAAFPDPVTGDTVHDSDAYNTLDAFNLSTQIKPKTDRRMEEDVDHYNIIL